MPCLIEGQGCAYPTSSTNFHLTKLSCKKNSSQEGYSKYQHELFLGKADDITHRAYRINPLFLSLKCVIEIIRIMTSFYLPHDIYLSRWSVALLFAFSSSLQKVRGWGLGVGNGHFFLSTSGTKNGTSVGKIHLNAKADFNSS